jgi:hypothetical protein
MAEAATLLRRRTLSGEERGTAQQQLCEAQLGIYLIFRGMLDASSPERRSYEEQPATLIESRDERGEAEPDDPNLREGFEQISVCDSLDLSPRQEIMHAVESAYELGRWQSENKSRNGHYCVRRTCKTHVKAQDKF